MNIAVIFTCYNRREKTVRCMKSLVEGNLNYSLRFIIVDDNSTDGTREAIELLHYDVDYLIGDGNLFWSGGMRKGIGEFLEYPQNTDYVLFVNDDVLFYSGIIDQLVNRSMEGNRSVVVGATCDDTGELSYGAMKLIVPRKRDLYYHVKPQKEIIDCDTFNCNCVLLPSDAVISTGNFDGYYKHSLADLDYGFMLKKQGIRIINSESYIGVCNKNTREGTWRDTSLGFMERLKRKESIKGSPFKQWYYFMKKNFGFWTAIRYSFSPYVRILLRK